MSTSHTFVLGQRVSLEEDETYEFKSVTSGRPADAIANTDDEYVVGFLNGQGGIVLWGISDEGLVIGVSLQRADLEYAHFRTFGRVGGESI